MRRTYLNPRFFPWLFAATSTGLAAFVVTPAPPKAKSRATPSVCAAGAHGVGLEFASEFAGVSSEDYQSNLWTGRVTGPVSGALRMTLAPLGPLTETANPVWKVRTQWTVLPASLGAGPLVAELYGTVNWKTGFLRLSGVVGEGCLKGAEAVVHGRFADLDGSGTLEILPAVALR